MSIREFERERADVAGGPFGDRVARRAMDPRFDAQFVPQAPEYASVGYCSRRSSRELSAISLVIV
jgi:hypothetical protein